HSFTRQARYQAGSGLYGVKTGSADVVLSSQQETVAAAAADFTGDGRADLLALDAGAQGLTLLQGSAAGRFADARPAAPPVPATARPSAAIVADFDHNGAPDVAVLMEGLGQV